MLSGPSHILRALARSSLFVGNISHKKKPFCFVEVLPDQTLGAVPRHSQRSVFRLKSAVIHQEKGVVFITKEVPTLFISEFDAPRSINRVLRCIYFPNCRWILNSLALKNRERLAFSSSPEGRGEKLSGGARL